MDTRVLKTGARDDLPFPTHFVHLLLLLWFVLAKRDLFQGVFRIGKERINCMLCWNRVIWPALLFSSLTGKVWLLLLRGKQS